MDSENQCPVADGFDATPSGRRPHQDWWPNQLKLDGLERKPPSGNPMGPTFNYVEEFKSLDLDAVKKDIMALMTTSQEWWPADYGPVSYTHLDVYKRQRPSGAAPGRRVLRTALDRRNARDRTVLVRRRSRSFQGQFGRRTHRESSPDGCLLYTSRCV